MEGMVFQIGIAPVRVDILMSMDGLTFDEAWPNRKRLDMGGIECWVVAPEDLIKNKESAGRPQDLADVHNLKRALKRER